MTKKELKLKAKTYGVNSLLNIDANAKTIKGSKRGYQTGIMYLMPDDILCPSSKIAGCREACLVSAGRAAIFQQIQKTRKLRTNLFHKNKSLFMELLVSEIKSAIKKAKKSRLIPVFRLNGTSDIDWSAVKIKEKNIFELFPDIQFYDYTKRINIIRKSEKIDNWHITASYSNSNEKYSDSIIKAAEEYQVNLAVVFDELPDTFLNNKVLNGDESDLRFLDESGIVGLRAKGGAKKDSSGFVQRISAINI